MTHEEDQLALRQEVAMTLRLIERWVVHHLRQAPHTTPFRPRAFDLGRLSVEELCEWGHSMIQRPDPLPSELRQPAPIVEEPCDATCDDAFARNLPCRHLRRRVVEFR